MQDDFRQLIGTIIHHCAVLEQLVNNTIMALGTDGLLSSEITKAPFYKRIAILERLLEREARLSGRDIKCLCKQLREIAKERNAVAHNPIVREGPERPETEYILVVRHAPQKADLKKMTSEELRSLVNRSQELLVKFLRLVPDSLKG